MSIFKNENEISDSYLDDQSDASSEIQNSNQKFCNSCGGLCFQISYKEPDLFRCSVCGRNFSIVEKKNLIVKERMAPISTNKIIDSMDTTVKAEAFDAYEPLEMEKKKSTTNEIVNSIIGNIDASVTLTKKRSYDEDDLLLIQKGLTIIDLD